MAMTMLRLKAGVNVELTPSLLEAGYAVSSLGRFRSGLLEKLGGWEKFYAFAVGGVPKCLHAWLDLNESQYLGVGSTTTLGAISGTDNTTRVLTNITPQTLSSSVTADFSTTNGSPNVIVADTSIANVTTYDSVEFKTPIAVGGLILSGVYPIDVALSATTYRIVAASNATATVNNAGAVPSFTTSTGSQIVTVGLTAHGLAVGDTINFPISTTGSGVTISGTYTAATVPGANTFTISVAVLATSATTFSMNSGAAKFLYYIALGPAAVGTGYGIGTYSSGGYSTGTNVTAQTGTPITATNWALDNWGETLLANPENGGIYAWTPNTGFQNAQLLSGAPLYNTGFFVSMQTQMVIAYGSTTQQTIGLDQDPLLVKWSAQSNYFSWEESPTSQAASRRLPTGSKIVSGMSVPQQELLWTDLDLWSMSYLGFPDAWGFLKIGSSCGLIGKHAAVRMGANVFWMSRTNFFVLGGSAPQVIPCTVWDAVFQDLNGAYADRCWAWANTPFNEVCFYYPRASTNAVQPDAYAKYNISEQVWDIGPLDRSCGIDQSIVGMPVAASSVGLIYEHEVTPDADGQALMPSFTTGWFQISEGQDIAFVDWILPDMQWRTYGSSTTSASVQITLYSVYYPGETPVSYGPYTVTQDTRYINPRLRGRLAKLQISSTDLGTWWRLGGCRVRIAMDGRLP